jgi:hypothetical protein
LKQHSIQEKYFKPFEDKGRVWAFSSVNVKPRPMPAKKCTMEINFQSEERDAEQNNTIERGAIAVIRSLRTGAKINDKQADLFISWTNLHIIRNQKFRNHSDINYNKDCDKLLDIENKFSLCYNHITRFLCSDDEFFITSDNPVIETEDKGCFFRYLTISPKEMILISQVLVSYPPKPSEISLAETVNSQLFANRHKYIYSHSDILPLERYEENFEKYNQKGNMEIQKFSISK